MKTLKLSFAALLGAFVMSACMPAAAPVVGNIFADVKWNGEADGGLGSKEGTACAQSILGLVAMGDASVKTAANDGGIKEIKAVDHSTKNILGIFATYCTIVRGN